MGQETGYACGCYGPYIMWGTGSATGAHAPAYGLAHGSASTGAPALAPTILWGTATAGLKSCWFI